MVCIMLMLFVCGCLSHCAGKLRSIMHGIKNAAVRVKNGQGPDVCFTGVEAELCSIDVDYCETNPTPVPFAYEPLGTDVMETEERETKLTEERETELTEECETEF